MHANVGWLFTKGAYKGPFMEGIVDKELLARMAATVYAGMVQANAHPGGIAYDVEDAVVDARNIMLEIERKDKESRGAFLGCAS